MARIEIGGTPSRNIPAFWADDKEGHSWVSIADMIGKWVYSTRERITDAGVRHSNVKLVPTGTPLMSFKLTVGRVALAARDLYTNEAIAAFHVDRDRVDPYWLVHVLPSASSRVVTDTAIKGSTLNKRKLQLIPLFLPPLPEQRCIAEIIDTIDEAIREAERVVAKLQQLKQGLLRDLLTLGIDDSGELRDPEGHPEQFKDSPLGRIPKGWEVRFFMDLASLPSGQLDPRIEPYRSSILVAPDHVEERTGRLISRQTAAEQGAISGKYGFQPGDVIYSKIRPYLRKAILAEFHGLCSADMYPLRPADGVHPRYLLALVLGDHFSRFTEAVSMRSGFPKVNREELAEYRAAVPQPQEGGRIAEVLIAFDRRQEAAETELAKLRNLKQGLMGDLLTGRVRVKLPEETAA